MRSYHERLARVGLDAVDRYGFVLAGGYALSANGIGDRPSMDVDLFTNSMDEEAFSRAVDAGVSAFAQFRRVPAGSCAAWSGRPTHISSASETGSV